MKRKLFSSSTRCEANCKYCFAKWPEYNGFKEFNIEEIDENNIIVYPNCDGNFFGVEFEKDMNALLKSKQKIYVSISTKLPISINKIERLKELDKKLQTEKRGFVKISVSFSCMEQLKEIEENTLQYEGRIQLISSLSSSNMKYATIIKPILPFVSINEYMKIVDDTIKYSRFYILGGLYLQNNSEFFTKYLKGKFKTIEKNVSWNNDIKWLFTEDMQLTKAITEYIEKKGGVTYKSDKELIESLIK